MQFFERFGIISYHMICFFSENTVYLAIRDCAKGKMSGEYCRFYYEGDSEKKESRLSVHTVGWGRFLQ